MRASARAPERGGSVREISPKRRGQGHAQHACSRPDCRKSSGSVSNTENQKQNNNHSNSSNENNNPGNKTQPQQQHNNGGGGRRR